MNLRIMERKLNKHYQMPIQLTSIPWEYVIKIQQPLKGIVLC